MPHRRVLITTGYLGPGDEIDAMLTTAGCEVSYSRPQDRTDDAHLTSALAQADALIAGTDPYGADLIAAAPSLGVIARTGAGYDNIDLAAAGERGIVVCCTPGANSRSVAELAIGLVLACARNIVSSAAQVRDGRWVQASGRQLSGSTLGIVGFGGIGQEVASLARAFGMRVLVHDPVVDESRAAELGVEPRDLAELLAESDFVTLHLGLSPATRHLIDADALALMRPDAYLINTARGGIVDERALAGALERGELAGAALDVLETEPMAPDDPLRGAPNLVVVPHVAGATTQARRRSGEMAAAQVIAHLDGLPVEHEVAVPAPPTE
ncbi:phosphoglycerate dehydrogenase [Georgenia sp. Z1491]|uniref:phosphoglycerate dehydrogenase n=1 Tax=Georgenia sp. Z1491 TaxID=3416707 RepID=UPI003CE95981